MSRKWAKENPEKQKEYRRKYYQENKKKEIAYSIERNKECKKRIQKYIKEVKENSECAICNENHPATLIFHHINPDQKLFGIAGSYSRYTLTKIKEEMNKCAILCSNCHLKIHWDESFKEKYNTVIVQWQDIGL